jgi:WD40 repeat protein
MFEASTDSPLNHAVQRQAIGRTRRAVPWRLAAILVATVVTAACVGWPPPAPESQSRATLGGFVGRPMAVAFGGDGASLAVFDTTGGVSLWDSQTGVPRAGCQGLVATDQWRTFAADGRTMATGAVDGTLILRDSISDLERVIPEGHPGCLALALSPDGATLASGGADGAVVLWDTAKGRQRARLQWHLGPVCCLAFAPDGRTLASGGWDESLVLWETATGTRRIVSRGRAGHRVLGVAFSPDGRTLVSTSSDSPALRLWEVSSGRPQAELVDGADVALCVAFSPDGRTLASGHRDGTVRLWDLASRRASAVVREHDSWVVSVSFAPNGRALASAGQGDGTVKLWDVAGLDGLRPWDTAGASPEAGPVPGPGNG